MTIKEKVIIISEEFDFDPYDILDLEEEELNFLYSECVSYDEDLYEEKSDSAKLAKYEKDLAKMKELGLKIQRMSITAGTPEVEELTDKIEEMIKKLDTKLDEAKKTGNFTDLEYQIKKERNTIKRMIKTAQKYVKSHKGVISKPVLWFLLFNFFGLLIHFGVLSSRRKRFFKEVSRIRMENKTKDRMKLEQLVSLASKSLTPVSIQEETREDILNDIKRILSY